MTFSEIAPFLAIILTAVITWMVSRRKEKKEVAKLDLENVESVIAIWKSLVEGLKKDIKDLTTEVESLRTENKILKTEMVKLEKVIREKTAL